MKCRILNTCMQSVRQGGCRAMRKHLHMFWLLALPVHAANTPPVDQISALETRIKLLEANSLALQKQATESLAALHEAQAQIEQLKQAQTAAATSTVVATPEANQASNSNAFNPDISIILNGSYTHHSRNPDDYLRAGFPLAGDAGPGPQGLSLGESEIALSSNIDEKFYGQLTLNVASENAEDKIGVEEAFIDTTALPSNLTLRAGRFFSGIGYLNNHHTHTDNFADRPLAYQAFLGSQYGDDGVQIRWLAPTDLFLELGGELLRGANYPSGGEANDGVGVHTLFAHAGGDVGVENSWLAGVSLLQSKTQNGDDGFSGDGHLYVTDLTWKWAPQGNAKDGGVTLRTEYFLDDRDGVVVDSSQPSVAQSWQGQRRGAYLEGVWRLNRLWDAGYRYDRLWAANDGPFASAFDPYRHNLMLTWRNSEFSLVRLQFSQDHPNSEQTDNAVSLQYQTALGAHGAHKF
jgi:hypothetical protein